LETGDKIMGFDAISRQLRFTVVKIIPSNPGKLAP